MTEKSLVVDGRTFVSASLMVLPALLAGCSSSSGSSSTSSSIEDSVTDAAETFTDAITSATDAVSDALTGADSTTVTVRTSTDKHVQYVQNYVGMNLANAGYTSLAGDRRDYLGNGSIKLALLAPGGVYIDVADDSDLQRYRVVGQSPAPDTEVNIVYQVNSEGEEYDNLVDYMSYDEILLILAEVGGQNDATVTEVSAAPDKYTRYLRDYNGRNLAACGYVSLAEEYRDYYGSGSIRLNVQTDDGSYVDLSDESLIGQRRVTGQSLPVDTPIAMGFTLATSDVEMSIATSENPDSVTLTVTRV